MTEAEIEAGEIRLAKFAGEYRVYEHAFTDVRYPAYHEDLNAIARVERKILDKYPEGRYGKHWKQVYSCPLSSTIYYTDDNEFCAQWYSGTPQLVEVFAETEALARFEAALKILDIEEAK